MAFVYAWIVPLWPINSYHSFWWSNFFKTKVCWFELSLALSFSLTLTVRGVSNKHCLLTFFIFCISQTKHRERSGSVCAWLETKGLRVWASPASLSCVVEQDTLILAKYWFNPGRPVPTYLKSCWLGRKEPNQTNKKSTKTCVVGTQKNHSFEHPKHMFKLMEKKTITDLC